LKKFFVHYKHIIANIGSQGTIMIWMRAVKFIENDKTMVKRI